MLMWHVGILTGTLAAKAKHPVSLCVTLIRANNNFERNKLNCWKSASLRTYHLWRNKKQNLVLCSAAACFSLFFICLFSCTITLKGPPKTQRLSLSLCPHCRSYISTPPLCIIINKFTYYTIVYFTWFNNSASLKTGNARQYKLWVATRLAIQSLLDFILNTSALNSSTYRK